MEVSVRCDQCGLDNDQSQENMTCASCVQSMEEEKSLLENKIENLEEEIEILKKELQEKE